MARCQAIKRGGERCKLEATHGSYCWSHAEGTAEERRRRARRGGKAGGNGRGGVSELRQIKGELRGVISDVLSGRVQRGAGSVAFQGYNCLLRACELERKVRELEEFEERLNELESRARRSSEWPGTYTSG